MQFIFVVADWWWPKWKIEIKMNNHYCLWKIHFSKKNKKKSCCWMNIIYNRDDCAKHTKLLIYVIKKIMFSFRFFCKSQNIDRQRLQSHSQFLIFTFISLPQCKTKFVCICWNVFDRLKWQNYNLNEIILIELKKNQKKKL